MTKSELAAKMQENGAWLPGKTVKLDFGDDGTIMLDGKTDTVSEDGGDADTTIKIAWDDWQAMAAGTLDGIGRKLHPALLILVGAGAEVLAIVLPVIPAMGSDLTRMKRVLIITVKPASGARRRMATAVWGASRIESCARFTAVSETTICTPPATGTR